MKVFHFSEIKLITQAGIYLYIKSLIEYEEKIGIIFYMLEATENNKNIIKTELIHKIKPIKPDLIHILRFLEKATCLIPILRTNNENIIITPNGMFNDGEFSRSEIKKNLALFLYEKKSSGIDVKNKLILFLRRIESEKGIKEIIESWNQLIQEVKKRVEIGLNYARNENNWQTIAKKI